MNNAQGYGAIAHIYDIFNGDVDYESLADFAEECFDRFLPKRPELVLDLACGTGTMTRELSSRGYDMIGVDGSEDMLSEAYSKDTAGILYLCQDMREFELYGTVDVIICLLDSFNYITDISDLEKAVAALQGRVDALSRALYEETAKRLE